MCSEKFIKNSVKILTIFCTVLIRRVPKGKLDTQRALKAQKGHLGTRRALMHLDTQGYQGTLISRFFISI